MEKESKKIMASVAASAIAGVIAGILLAPKSGEETRKDIAKYIHEIKDDIANELSKISDLTQEKYKEIVAKVVGVYEKNKKLPASEAKKIKGRLEENFAEVKLAASKKK